MKKFDSDWKRYNRDLIRKVQDYQKEQGMHNEKENVKQGQNILGGYHTGCNPIFAFNTLPMIKGVIYSFTNYKGYGTYDYVGFRNYADLFTDSRVGKMLFVYV